MECAVRDYKSSISLGDAMFPLRLLLQTAIAWFCPESSWHRIAPLIARVKQAIRSITSETSSANVGPAPTSLSRDAQLRRYARGFESNLQLLKCYRPGGWAPTIRTVGLEHLEASLEKGSGVVLWMGNFTAYSLVGKMALHQAGHRVTHLSEPYHGFSITRFGVLFLNPVCTCIENRYIADRILISDHRPEDMKHLLLEKLQQNGIISITASAATSKTPVTGRILGKDTMLAVGALTLAYAARSAVLPVFPIQTGTGQFTVTIMPDIANRDATCKKEFVDAALETYFPQLESFVRMDQSQWLG